MRKSNKAIVEESPYCSEAKITAGKLSDLRGDKSKATVTIQLQNAGVNIGEEQYRQMENGNAPIRDDVLRGLCQIYGVSPNYIMGFRTDFNNTLSDAIYELESGAKKLEKGLRLLNKLNKNI